MLSGTVWVPGGICFGRAGVTGTVCFAGVLLRSRMVELAPLFRMATIESDSDVHMKTMAEMVVAFESSVAEPRGPNAVCEPMPPKAPARSAAFPLCNKTTMIRKTQTTTWMMVNNIYMLTF